MSSSLVYFFNLYVQIYHIYLHMYIYIYTCILDAHISDSLIVSVYLISTSCRIRFPGCQCFKTSFSDSVLGRVFWVKIAGNYGGIPWNTWYNQVHSTCLFSNSDRLTCDLIQLGTPVLGVWGYRNALLFFVLTNSTYADGYKLWNHSKHRTKKRCSRWPL